MTDLFTNISSSQPYRPTASRWRVAHEPVDGAALGVFRVGLGLILLVSTARLIASGWVERFWIEPKFFFRYWALEWVPIPSPTLLWSIVIGQGLLALCLTIGWRTRQVALGLMVLFTWTESIDVTTYLNHYYLVTLVLGLLAWLPGDPWVSVDTWFKRRRGDPVTTAVPAWAMWLVRGQFAVVWTFAGLAKLEPDWLVHAWPLQSWLQARSEWPWVGHLFTYRETAFLFSWGGLAYDLSITWLLLWRRTRPAALVAAAVFHGLVGCMFDIGIFPFVMLLGSTVFCHPSWPRRWLSQPDEVATAPFGTRRQRRIWLTCAAAWMVVQVGTPCRVLMYPGSVVWAEEGMRFGWRVLLREKQGHVTFRVRQGSAGRDVEVSPRRYLDGRQEREMAGQPDLILQLAHHIAADFRAKGWREVQVRCDALVSLNGRAPRHLVDPTVNLAAQSDGLGPKPWITARPPGPPARLGRGWWTSRSKIRTAQTHDEARP